jgi:hypothetical protein
MKRLPAMMLLAAVLSAGCAVQVGGGPATGSDRNQRERELCEESRGSGVWLESAGVCIRGGGGG